MTLTNGWKRRCDDGGGSSDENGNRFAVTLISPPHYIHSGALFEVAETVHFGLLALGYDSILTTRVREQGRRSILFGAHLLPDCDCPEPAADSIVYNFEQIDRDSAWITSPYMKLLCSHRVWDYSQSNIDVLLGNGIRAIAHVPVGWVPQLERIVPAPPEIDILFYGSINERRKKILDELKANGIIVECLFGVYGKERDAMIARSKIVLNMHYYESKIFEIARVFYLLGNGICVVSEQGLDPVEEQFADGVAFSCYEDLVATCLRLLDNDIERRSIAAHGKMLMQALREEAFLENALKQERHALPKETRRVITRADEATTLREDLNTEYQMAKYRITSVPAGRDRHSDCFNEVAETLQSALHSLGHNATIGEVSQDASCTTIVLGAHLLAEVEAMALPDWTVVYNFESLDNPMLPAWYLGLASRVRIWDSNSRNLDIWLSGNFQIEPRLVELGFAPELRRIVATPNEDIDVLFYGSLNERRLKVLHQLDSAGLTVQAACGVYGRERDALIARSKVVVNIHADDTDSFEMVRVSYLLANAKAVVSEVSADTENLSDVVCFAEYDDLAAECIRLVKDQAERQLLQARGFRLFSSRNETRILASVVGRCESALPIEPTAAGSTIPGLRNLYLDMIQRAVVNTIYEDPNQDRWSPHKFNGQLREFGRDWPMQAHSMIGTRRMANLRAVTEHVLEHKIPGDFIETGVWRGGACIMMRAVLNAYGDTQRSVWVADSFCGLPAPKPEMAADCGDQHYQFSELFVSSEQVRANFAKYGLLDGQVRFLEGWFSETLPTAPIEKLAILRLDGDMYESTWDALTALYDKVSQGGIIIVDDYGAVAGCQKAILEFRRQREITDTMYDIDGYGVFWQKSKQAVLHQAA